MLYDQLSFGQAETKWVSTVFVDYKHRLVLVSVQVACWFVDIQQRAYCFVYFWLFLSLCAHIFMYVISPKKLVGWEGLEPSTLCLRGTCSEPTELPALSCGRSGSCTLLSGSWDHLDPGSSAMKLEPKEGTAPSYLTYQVSALLLCYIGLNYYVFAAP